MKVIVLGAGVVGVTTAYVLASRGYDVTVIERNPGPAEETSFANGGQLSYSHAEPWANPSVPRKLPNWLMHEDSPLICRPRADLAMMRWGMQFLYNCTTGPSRTNCMDMLRLGLYSRKMMQEIRTKTAIEFDFLATGIIHIFSTQVELEAAKRQADFQHHYGCDEKILTTDEVMQLEPAFRHTSREIVGGIHAHQDESGDPYLYSKALCEWLQKHHRVEFLFNTEVKELKLSNGQIAAVATNHGDYSADAYVVSLASFSPVITAKIGVKLPIYPMKGYSVTIPASADAPTTSITDGSYKIVYSRLGNRVRVAGTAEFAGYNTDILSTRINPIVKQASRLFPQLDWNTGRTEWACIRPSTPDGPPRIGKTKYPNLFVNTGHGTLGWTQAAGSSYILADIMQGITPAVTSNGPMIRT